MASACGRSDGNTTSDSGRAPWGREVSLNKVKNSCTYIPGKSHVGWDRSGSCRRLLSRMQTGALSRYQSRTSSRTGGSSDRPHHRPELLAADCKKDFATPVPQLQLHLLQAQHCPFVHTLSSHHTSTSPLLPSIIKSITMASSLRMAAPKMASMAAQSSVKVARSPMMKSQQLQKFTRAYSGELQRR